MDFEKESRFAVSPVTRIGQTEPYATPSLWNVRYSEIDLNFRRLGEAVEAAFAVKASTTVAGLVELADSVEAVAGTDDAKAVTPAGVNAAIAAKAAPAASTTVAGIVALADSVEVIAGTDDAKAATPAGVNAAIAAKAAPAASATVAGLVELATVAEVTAGTDAQRAATPAGVNAAIAAKAAPAASATVAGLVELATVAEVTAGTDAQRAVTPAGVKAAIAEAVQRVGVYGTAARAVEVSADINFLRTAGFYQMLREEFPDHPFTGIGGGAMDAGLTVLGYQNDTMQLLNNGQNLFVRSNDSGSSGSSTGWTDWDRIVLEGDARVKFIYPNGTEAAPVKAVINTRYVVANPFGTRQVVCIPEIRVTGTTLWADPGWAHSAGGYGIKAGQLSTGQVYAQVGSKAIAPAANLGGGGLANVENILSGAADFRIKVIKVEG